MPKSKTLSREQLERDHARARKANPSLPEYRDRVKAPDTRGECDIMPRPCPFVGCRYHLFAHMMMFGDVKMPYGDDVETLKLMAETCTLDVADLGPQSQYRVSRLLNLTQQAVAKVEQKALAKVRQFIEDADADTGADM